jgi:predicted N-acyltransferase
MSTNLNFVDNFDSIDEAQYSKLIRKNDAPFIQYSFLKALENSGCVGRDLGWTPKHLVKSNENVLSGFLPMYIKNNSHGEFVFDHSWSYALNRAGRNYYPKLLTAIPFTPCETRKIITESDANEYVEKIIEFMEEKNIESWHVLYPDVDLKELFLENKLVERFGYKFIWKNKEYETFNDYLNIFKSRQRKNIKNERKKISDLNITFQIKESDSLTLEDWEEFFKFYKNTYEERLQRPYLNIDFFKEIHKFKKILKPVIFFAVHDDKKIAGSLCFIGNDTLYGRHWGSSFNIDSLHFETCFYQGIEFCIDKKINYFDPGVQGEHKIRRGFEPIRTSSFHYIKENDFRNAIIEFCEKEEVEINRYLKACERYTPFNKEYKI